MFNSLLFPARESQSLQLPTRNSHTRETSLNSTERSSSATFILPIGFPSPLLSTLPLTVSASAPMTETLRRRLRPSFIPSIRNIDPALPSRVGRPSPPLTTNKKQRPIKVISASALDDEAKPSRTSVLSGYVGTILTIVLHLAVATVFLAIAEGWSLLDALYFSVVIATTVGYGDLTPTKSISKAFVALYAIISVIFIANLLQKVVERFATAQRDMAASARSVFLRTLTSKPSSSLPSGDQSPTESLSITPYDDLLKSMNAEVMSAQLRFSATLLMLVGTCLSGVILYTSFMKSSIIDILYFLAITMTTVGLGDIHPVTRFGKVYAIFWLVLMSLGFANVISQYANLKLKERERDAVHAVLVGTASEKMFEEIDDDQDGTLSEAEYLGYIFCKLKKVSPSEVRGIIQRFRELDRDGSGFISRDEIIALPKKDA